MSFMNIWFMSFLFNGIMVPVSQVIWPFRLMCYSLMYRWAQPALTYLAFHYSPNYEGASFCHPASNTNVDGSTLPLGKICISLKLEDGKGFYCPDIPDIAGCYGVTGAQVLTSIGQSFQTINDKDQWFDFSMLLLAIAAALKIYHMTVFFIQCQASEAPRTSINAPTGTSPGRAALPVTRDIEVFTTESERT